MAKKQTASEYIYQDGQWIKVGKSLAVAQSSSGGGSSTDSIKHIYLTTHSVSVPGVDTSWSVRFLRVNLVNFDDSDIGNKIFLYRKSRHKGSNYRKNWNHPLDYTVAVQNGKNIAGYGYGCRAGKRAGEENGVIINWLPLNEYQITNGHNGFAQTEWELTTEDINNGYKDINISEMVIDLLGYGRWTNAYSSWTEVSQFKLACTGVFKLDVVDSSGKQITYSNEAALIDINADLGSMDAGQEAYASIANNMYQGKYAVHAGSFIFKILR